jgi:hypothetical protein
VSIDFHKAISLTPIRGLARVGWLAMRYPNHVIVMHVNMKPVWPAPGSAKPPSGLAFANDRDQLKASLGAFTDLNSLVYTMQSRLPLAIRIEPHL